MANSVGALTVTLGLDAASYVSGLTKAEYQAKQFAQNTRAAILEVGKVLSFLQISNVVFEATKAILAEAAALNDLASATGSTVEEMSRLNNQARIAGADFNKLNDAVLKLGAGMSGADGKGQQVNETLKLLGITAKDPAQVLQQVAVKLSTYADGVNKIGLAQRLFGGTGREFLKVLQDMAELQDVQATVTAKQAREAEELEKAWRRLSVESETFKNVILSELVPALLRLTTEFTEGIKIAGSFGEALRTLGTINPFKSAAENVADYTQRLEKLKAGTGAESFFANFFGTKEEVRRGLEVARAFESSRLARQQAANPALRAQEDRGFTPPKPTAPGPPGGGAGRGARALKEQTTEAQRYLESLEKQLQKTQELTVVETILADIEAGRLQGLNAGITRSLLAVGAQIDAANALKKSEEERKKAAEEAAKAEERINEATKSAIKSAMDEVEAIKAGNDQLREQIAFLKGGEEAVNRLTDAKLQATIVEKEATLVALKRLDADQEWIAQVEGQIRVLKERQGLIGEMRLAEKMREEAVALQEVKNLMSDALVDPLTDFITGAKSAKDAFRDLVNDITRQISRIASQNIANAIFGGNTSGGADIFGVLAKLAAASFSGGTGVGFSGGGFGEHFASGGISRGGWAMVGERGPEAVRLPRGAQVIPNEVLTARRAANNISINVNVAGNTSRATADQVAVRTGLAVRRAMARNA